MIESSKDFEWSWPAPVYDVGHGVRTSTEECSASKSDVDVAGLSRLSQLDVSTCISLVEIAHHGILEDACNHHVGERVAPTDEDAWSIVSDGLRGPKDPHEPIVRDHVNIVSTRQKEPRRRSCSLAERPPSADLGCYSESESRIEGREE